MRRDSIQSNDAVMDWLDKKLEAKLNKTIVSISEKKNADEQQLQLMQQEMRQLN